MAQKRYIVVKETSTPSSALLKKGDVLISDDKGYAKVLSETNVNPLLGIEALKEAPEAREAPVEVQKKEDKYATLKRVSVIVLAVFGAITIVDKLIIRKL